jgi:hypothetical protein
MTGIPWLGASASRTFRGITLSNTWEPKKPLRSAATCFESVVRSSYMVKSMPSITSAGLIVRRRRINVSRSSETPSKAKYSHCIGTRTESLAASAFSVKRSREGGQSISMYVYLSRIGWMAAFNRYSRFSIETSSTVAPTRFLSEGIRSSPSICASIKILSIGSFRISVW